LDVDQLHGFVLGRPIKQAEDYGQAARAYAELVASAPDQRLWDEALRQQIYLGEQNFIDRVQQRMEGKRARTNEVPASQRSKPMTLSDWMGQCSNRAEALQMAHERSAITMAALAKELGLTAERVSQLIKQARMDGGESTESIQRS